MPAATQNFGPFKQGDTIEPITVRLEIDGAPPVSPIASVAIDLRRNGARFYRYSTADLSITLDASDQFTIAQHRLDIPGANYDYDCQITFADGTVKTYLEGLWLVDEDVTKDA